MSRALTIVVGAALAAGGVTAGARDLIVLDGSPSVERRDPERLTLGAARLLVAASDPARSIALYDLDGELVYASEQRSTERDLAAMWSALGRASRGAMRSDLATAITRVTARESASPSAKGGRVLLVGDGVPSLSVDEWESVHGVDAGSFATDPVRWQRAAERALDRRLAAQLSALSRVGASIWWIAPRGRPPGPETARVVRESGGQVLAGGGLADLERLMGLLDEGGAAAPVVPVGDDPREIRVPPGATLLEILFCQPVSDTASLALHLTSPSGEEGIHGLGEAAGHVAIADPEPGRWVLRRKGATRSGLARVEIETSLRLEAVDPFDGPATPGGRRSGSVAIVDSASLAIDPGELDEVELELILGDAPSRKLSRRNGRWVVPIELPEGPGQVSYEVSGRLAQGPFEWTVSLTGAIEVHDLELDVSIPDGPILAGRPRTVRVRVLSAGKPLLQALEGAMTIHGLPGGEQELERRGLDWEGTLSFPAGFNTWRVEGEIELEGGRLPLSAEGGVRAGDLALHLEGRADGARWLGTLSATSTVPADIELVVSWAGAPGSVPAYPPGSQRLLLRAPEEEERVEVFEIAVPAPTDAGSYRWRLVAAAPGLQGFEGTHIDRELHVLSWWERYGRGTLLVFVILALVIGGIGIFLFRRPYLQGAITVTDRNGRELLSPVELSRQQSSLGSRRVKIGSGAGDTPRVSGGLGLAPGHITLRARRGDLGLVWTVLENSGSLPLVVSGEELRPGDRRALGHNDEIATGGVVLRYAQPMLADMAYTGSV